MSNIPEDLARSLQDRYVLQREIGRGGMATVFLAKDLKHNRDVAVKLLRPDLAATIGTDRFLREIEIAAQLNHPHIVPLLDSIDADGALLYVMPFIDGESLRSLMIRSGVMSLERVLPIVKAVADALSYAHRKGVVHRDIKPENILFQEGHAVVSDFGIAKAVSLLGARELTRTGFPIGTPGYMSPEQAAGRLDLDERSDVYSLACVCYEMLVGDVPAFWLSDDAVAKGRFIDASADHRARLDILPRQVEPALAAALTVRPTERVGSPDEFVDLLSRPSGRRRRYSNTEVKKIVHHAAAIEGQRPTETGALTMGGVKEIGAEVGLAPADVEAAARHMQQVNPLSPEPSGLGVLAAGAPMSISIERVIEGEVPEDEYSRLVEEIRVAFGNVGVVSTLARSLAWQYSKTGAGEGRDVHVTVITRANQTRIRIDERLGQIAGGLFGGIVGGGGGGGGSATFGILMGAAGLPVVAVVGAATLVTSCYLLARTLYTRTYRKRHKVLSALIDRLAYHCAQTAVIDPLTPPLPRRVSPS